MPSAGLAYIDGVETQAREPSRTFAALAATLAWAVLATQLVLSLTFAPVYDATRLQAVVNFFSYFTVLINLLAAIAFTSRLQRANSRAYRLFTDPRIDTAIASYITIAGIVYSLLLRSAWEPSGLQRIVDVALHDVMPVVYIVYWILFVRHGTVRWGEPLRWLIVPLIYVVYTLLRGALTSWYPYDFLDANALGVAAVLRISIGLAVAFWLVGMAFVALDQWLSRRHLA
jgi:hypothetical protein